MKGIRLRLTVIFMIVIICTVAILEILLIYIVRQNYYNSLEGSLHNQIKICADMYSKYYGDTSLQDNVLYNVDTFWNQSNAEVQIVDQDGNIIMDSQGIISTETAGSDIKEALDGKNGSWIGTVNGQKVMTVANPLKSGDKVVGALRFVASLSAVDQDILKTEEIFILIGLLVILIVGSVSALLANTIVVPLQEITSVAQKMARGNFQIKSQKKRDDEIGKLSDTLNYLADEIVKKEQLKNDFISSVSHELRTPLTSIKGFIDTMDEGELSDEQRGYLAIIKRNTARLINVVKDLLVLSRLEEKNLALELEPVDVADLIERVLKIFEEQIREKGFSAEARAAEGLLPVMGDTFKLEQVFVNLFDNAIKYTDAGGITVEIQMRGGNLVISVADTGPGIPSQHIGRIFERFYVVDKSRSKKLGGTGLGLSIVKHIILLHNGKIRVESTPGQGTKFIITLPAIPGPLPVHS